MKYSLIIALLALPLYAENTRPPVSIPPPAPVVLTDELEEIVENLRVHELHAKKTADLFPGEGHAFTARAEAMRDAIRIIEIVHASRTPPPVIIKPKPVRVINGRRPLR